MASEIISITDVIIFTLVWAVTYAVIISGKTNKHFAAFFGGTVAVGVAWVFRSFTEIEIVEHLTGDLIILAIIAANLIIVDTSTKSGIFNYIAIKILKLTKGQPLSILLYMGLLSVFLSIVVNNISAILVCASLTIIACKRLEYDPKPFIMAEMILVNVGGLYTLVSSVPNLIIATELEITYLEFLAYGSVFATVLVITSFVYFLLFFKMPKSRKTKEEQERIVNAFDEWEAVQNRKVFYLTAIVLGTMVVLFAISNFISLSIALISISTAIVLMILTKSDFDDTLQVIDWPLLSFFLGLFIVVAALDIVGALELVGNFIEWASFGNNYIGSIVILWFGAILSGIVDNIVIAAALSPLISSLSESGLSKTPLTWSLIVGANLGGNFTPLGSPSNVVGIAMLYKATGIKIGWSKWGSLMIVTVIHLVISTIIILILVFISS